MGLHSRTRYVIQPQGKDRTGQMRDIIDRAVFLFDRVQPVYCPDDVIITRKYARHLSQTLTFTGFTDDEVSRLVAREAERRRKVLGGKFR